MYQFARMRTFDLTAFSADPDPNVTAPNDAQILKIGKAARGHGLYFKAFEDNTPPLVEITAATFTFTTWWKDAGSGLWLKLVSEANAPSSLSFKAGIVGNLWVQVTAVNDAGGTADYAELWMG